MTRVSRDDGVNWVSVFMTRKIVVISKIVFQINYVDVISHLPIPYKNE